MALQTATNLDSGRRSWVAPFLAVVFGMIAMQMSNLGFSPLLPAIQGEFKINYAQLGLFTGVYGIMGIILSVPAGLLARKHGEKTVLLFGLSLITAGLVTLAASPTFAVALAGRVVWLSGYRLAFVCVMMAVALTAPPRLKGSTMGIVGAVSAFATVVGAPFGSEIGKAMGWRAGIGGYAILAAVGAVVFALLYRRDPEVDVPLPHGGTAAGKPQAQTPAHKVPVVWVMAGGIGLLNMGSFTMTFFIPVVVTSVFHLTPTDAAFMISGGYIGAIFANLLCGYIADRVERVNVMIGLGAVLAVAALGLMSTNLTVFRIATIVMVALGHTSTNQGYATVGAVLKGREVGPAMGIVSLGAGIYAYVGPQTIGLLRDWTGSFTAGFYMLSGAAALGVILMLGLKRSESRRTALAYAASGVGK